MAPAHSDLLLMLHMGQLHILLLGGGWRHIQVTADHELVYEDSRNGAQERGDDWHPPPVAAGPVGQHMWLGGGWAEKRGASWGEGLAGWGQHSREDF